MLWIVLSVLHALDPRLCYTDLPKLISRCTGSDIVIEPGFIGYPDPPTLDWTNIPGDGRHTVHPNGTLVIRNAEEEDSDMTASRGRRWSGGTPPPGSAPPSSP